MLPGATILLEALDRCGNALLRDSALEIAVLVVGANSKVGGLRECCALAALILGVDCVMSATFLVAVMGVMIEVSLAFHSVPCAFVRYILLAILSELSLGIFHFSSLPFPSSDGYWKELREPRGVFLAGSSWFRRMFCLLHEPAIIYGLTTIDSPFLWLLFASFAIAALLLRFRWAHFCGGRPATHLTGTVSRA